MFLGIVALGLPFAVTIGWSMAGPGPAAPTVAVPGGAGTIGSAPVRAVTPVPSVVDWELPHQVSVQTRMPGRAPGSRATSAPLRTSTTTPPATRTAAPPAPTPTTTATDEPTAAPTTEPPASVEPEATAGLLRPLG